MMTESYNSPSSQPVGFHLWRMNTSRVLRFGRIIIKELADMLLVPRKLLAI